MVAHLNLHQGHGNGRLKQAEDLLEGASIVVCMGDRLTLASFGMAMPIWPRLLAAVTTADEALASVREHKPDLFFATEDLEQGYGISLVREVERIHAPTRTLLFLRRENRLVVNEALEAGADGVMFISSIGSNRGDFLKALKRTSEGLIVTSEGYPVSPEIVIPDDARSISINQNGEVYAYFGFTGDAQLLGQFTLADFTNPKGLEALGDNIFAETEASGPAIQSTPGQDGLGTVRQGYIEESSVDPVKEITDLIEAQRGYELNSKVISAADQMLGAMVQLR